MKRFPKRLNRAVTQIRRTAKNSQKLKDACGRYQDIFAVYPQTLDMLPMNAKNVLLSHENTEEELSHAIPITTPDELQKFYK